MLISLCVKVAVDTDKIPDDFEEQICAAFREYTRGTAAAYMYQDKLSFIDLMSKHLHEAYDAEESVKKLILDDAEFRLDEYGEFPDADDYWNMDFMCACYKKGRQDACMYDHYTGDHHKDEVIMRLLSRAIKAVVNYEEENDED